MSNGKTTPASGDSAPPDLAIKNCKSALLYPNKAPLAKVGVGAGKWDLRATWAHVPTQTGADGRPIFLHTILVYFHGHHNGVKVDQDGSCVRPDWATPEIFKEFTVCTPRRYELDVMADAAPTRPIVLAPENTDPANRIKNIAGTFADSPNEFGAFISECTIRLSRLRKHASCGAAAETYLPPNRVSAIRRVIAVAHSGGGITLTPCAQSRAVNVFPSDLVQLDCLYGHDGGGEAFCTAQKAKGNIGMGNGRDQSRLIITTTGGGTNAEGVVEGTKPSADALIARLKQVLGLPHTVIAYDSRTKRPVLTAQQQKTITLPDNTTTLVPDFSKIGGGIMEIVHIGDTTPAPSFANLEFISSAMKNCPVVYVRTNVAHDLNPNVFIPLVVNSVGT